MGLIHATQKNPESGPAFSRAMIGSIRFEQPRVDFSTSKDETAPSKRYASHPVTCIISKTEGLISNFAIFLGNKSTGYSLQKYDPFFNISKIPEKQIILTL